jgi:hypothetical protein
MLPLSYSQEGRVHSEYTEREAFAAVMPSTLCCACEKIFDHNPQPGIEYPHHSSLEEFQHAKDQGCLLCNTIWEQIPKAIDDFRTTWSREVVGWVTWLPNLLFNSTGTMKEPDVLL